MSRLNEGLCHSWPGGVLSGTRASASAASGVLDRVRTVLWTSFYLRAGAAAQSTPRPTLSHPPSAPDRRRWPLSLGLSRKRWELRFFRNCSVASVIRPVEAQTSRGVECVCGREQDAVGGGGRLGTSGFGVQAGLICILVGHFLIA